MSGVIDVAVVGAGPAGLAAALAAGDLGCEVTLVDAGLGPGGQLHRQDLLFPGRGRARGAAAEQLPPSLARFRQVGQVRHLAATSVRHAARDRDGVVTLWVGGPEGGAETTVEVRAVVLATGATELVLPFPGWDLPGVTTAGAAQALLTSQGVTVGRRVLVGGSGPLLLPVAAGLVQAGVQVVAVLEATHGPADLSLAAAFPGQSREAAEVLTRQQVPLRTGYAVVACQGRDRVERAVIARLDREWRPVPGSWARKPWMPCT
jgi:NADPH-dependent 2,4-dienoyl-CoA reductase/sulfur reductase-like enzyme